MSPAIELNVRSLLLTGSSRPQTAQPVQANTTIDDYLSVRRRGKDVPASPTIPRQLSNLGREELHFESHRDSVEIVRGHIRRQEAESDHLKPNSLLAVSRDSIVLSKNKLERKTPSRQRSPSRRSRSSSPHARPSTKIRWNRSGGLSPILDASPPNQSDYGWRTMKQGKRSKATAASKCLSMVVTSKAAAPSPKAHSKARLVAMM